MNRLLLAACLIPLAGCMTAKVIQEPDRTFFYIQCMESGRTVTTCECIEKKTVEKTDMTTVKSDEDAAKFVPVLKEVVESKVCDPLSEVPAKEEPVNEQ